MQRPDWTRVAGGVLVVAMLATLVSGESPAGLAEWLARAGGLAIAVGLAAPRVSERVPRYWLASFLVLGVGSVWRLAATSAGPVEFGAFLLVGAVGAVVWVAFQFWRRPETAVGR